ncbi:MAG: hypothetical protein CFE26_08575 [Verrucomicrobiales bacterium VVV1]|nr:MAG: hypothetical protein CFE26_08575 [Verrucomicrobiales bacterium VVV1]
MTEAVGDLESSGCKAGFGTRSDVRNGIGNGLGFFEGGKGIPHDKFDLGAEAWAGSCSPIKFLISEISGGLFCASLLIRELEKNGREAAG